MDHTITSPTCYTPGTPREPKFDGDFLFNTGQKKPLATLDYVLFALSMIVPILIGFYQVLRTGCQMELEEYMLANRKMSFLPVGLSMITTFVSCITLVGCENEVYKNNTMYIWYSLSFIIVCPAMAYIYIPIFYRLEIKSIYQYLELRFNRAVRTAAACFFVIQMTCYISIVLYTPGTSFSAVSEINLWPIMMAVGLVCSIYVSLGGAKTVFYTDCFQVCIMSVGLLAFLIQAVSVVGTQTMWESGIRTKRIEFFDVRLNPSIRNTVWSMLLGGSGVFLGLNLTQTQVQRCLACRSLKEVQIAIWMLLPGCLFLVITATFIGMYMSAFYENCDPLHAKLVQHINEINIVFMQDTLGHSPGLQGLYLAVLFAATLSTLSSGLNSISMVVLEDFIRVFLEAKIHKNREPIISKAISIFFGIICLEFASIAHKFGGVLEGSITIHGILSGSALGAFSLGMFFPWVNEKGALVGLVGGIAITQFIDFLSQESSTINSPHCISNCNVTIFKNQTDLVFLDHNSITVAQEVHMNSRGDANVSHGIAYIWYAWIGCFSCIFIGLVVSHFTGNKDPKDIDHRLIVPLVDVVFPFYYLPEETKKYYRFGIDHSGDFNEGEEITGETVIPANLEGITGKTVIPANLEGITGETVIPANLEGFSKTEM